MKFAILDFEIIERGGINRIIEGLQFGLRANDCVADYYWCSRKGKARSLSSTEATMVGGRYYRLPAQQLSYGNAKGIADYRRRIAEYDVVMFMVACPHDIKGYQGDTSWMQLYHVAKELGKKIVVVIHDNLWDKYYEWYRQVSDLVDLHLFTCYQAKYDSLSRLPGRFTFLPTPLDTSQAGIYWNQKRPALCWMPQWKKWKGIYELVRALPQIEYSVNLYNTGIEFHNLRAKYSETWISSIGLNHVHKKKGNGKKEHQYWGALMPEQIPEVYRQHAASIDLSGSIGGRFDGQTSCVMLEAMLYGCVSVVNKAVVDHKFSPLRGRHDVVHHIMDNDPSTIAEGVNFLLSNETLRKQKAEAAIEFVREYADAVRHAAQFLQRLDQCNRVNYKERPWFYPDGICRDPIPHHQDNVYELGEYVSPYGRLVVPTTEDDSEEGNGDGSTVDDSEATGLVEVNPILVSPPTPEIVQGEIAKLVFGHSLGDRELEFLRRVAKSFLDVYGDPSTGE